MSDGLVVVVVAMTCQKDRRLDLYILASICVLEEARPYPARYFVMGEPNESI